MNHVQVEIYLLIMLECRIPLEVASKLFRISQDVLDEEIRMKANMVIFHQPLVYLQRECGIYPEKIAKGKWKAEIYLRQLQRILKIQDKAEKVRLLNDFIVALSGPDISFAINKREYSDAEKETILKYRIKYAISDKEMIKRYGVDRTTIARWEESLTDGELKTRCHILREYLADVGAVYSQKPSNHYVRGRLVNNE